ncbi:MAG: hypothetical protein AB8B63_08460 [Granulosicoccus sp.]
MRSHAARLRILAVALSLGLLSLLITMAALLWNDKRSNPDSVRVEDAETTISTIKIAREGFSDIILHRRGDQWEMAAPCVLPINEQRLTPLLTALQPAAHNYQATEVDLDAAGLTPAQTTVFLGDTRIDLGNADLQGTRRYSLRDKRVVQFVPDWVFSLVNGGISAFAELAPFGPELSELALAGHPPASASERLSWQALNAQQIIEMSALNLKQDEPEQQIVATVDGKAQTVNIYTHENFVALHPADTACAYILPPGTLPRDQDSVSSQ